MSTRSAKGNDSRQMFKTGFDNSKLFKLSDAELHELQETLLEMLNDIIVVCNRNNIAYTLGGGSVLGAVRHKGFIPWDDDIDINMSRKAYIKFSSVFENELSSKYELWAPQKGNKHGMAHSQIKKKDTIYKSLRLPTPLKCVRP